MPNRILKDSICTSDNLDMLTAEEEVFWYRLIVQCDDYGRMDARPAILRARCYPLRLDTVSEQNVLTWLISLKRAGLIHVYEIDGKQYLQIATWDKHQQIRAKRSKYPPMISDDINSDHLQSDAPVIQSNPIQSEPEPETDLASSGSSFALACRAYENNVGLLTKIIADKLEDDVTTYGGQWVLDAIGIAVTAEKRDLRYIEGILRKWKSNGRANSKEHKTEQAAEVW